MESPRQITVLQATAIVVSTIIGVGVLALPSIAVKVADTGAPLVTLLGVAIAVVGLVLITLLGIRFPNQSIMQYSEDIIGKWPAWIGSACLIAFFAVLTSLTAREFGEVVETSVLQMTSLEVTVIVMLLLAAISARNDITTLAYIHFFYSPILIFPIMLMLALSMKNADPLNRLPIWGNEAGGMLEGAVTVAALFQGSFIVTVVIPAMRRPEKVMTASLWGILIAGGHYVLIVAGAVSVFGAEEIKHLLWPTLELAKATSLPANVLERLDAAFLAVWVTAVFTTLYSSYFLVIHGISKLFRLRDHKMFSFFMLPFVFVMAMVPQNIFQMYRIIEVVGRFGLMMTIVYPGLLWTVSIIRKKRGDQVENKPMDETG
ncbi:GerAB/ArcD/ProY family transporter [Paenibacillus beijingensis]|uniref:GerAB/ArcD/ProY family transporter n=1 Tax=Paenibacillus beijingensis TaxID=1126833 RepID=UPI000A6B7CAE|nr:endospore germination permease [Paenibacillus beijingensis]